MKSIKKKDPTLAWKQIQILNDILAFADDTLIYAQSIFDIKKAIKGITIEIQRIGLEINPLKCSLMVNGETPREELTHVQGAKWPDVGWLVVKADFDVGIKECVKI